MSTLSKTWTEIIGNELSDYQAVNNSTSMLNLLTLASGQQRRIIPSSFGLGDGKSGNGLVLRAEAAGTFGTTGTPTLIFTLTFGTSTTWSSGDTAMAVSAAITTGSGVANQYWEMAVDLTCRTAGIGTGACTFSVQGRIWSQGFASPFIYPMLGQTPPTSTWTSSIDGSATQYVGLGATWSAASPSNTIICKAFRLLGRN